VAHKGAHFLVEALRHAALGAVQLTLFGQVPAPDYAAELKRRAVAVPGLTLRIWGSYEPTSLPALVSEVDCVVVPSLVPESYCIAAREALVLGLPVLVSRLGALPEAVAEGENGCTFDPHDPRELGEILRRLAREQGLLARLAAGAARTAVPTSAEYATAMRGVYSEAVEARQQTDPDGQADLDELAFLGRGLSELGFADRVSNAGRRPPRR
jgi:glycosyltransferase involved in cell wall biosynthesis